MSSSNSPCAACKLLRRKCTQECVFAPYFPPDQPQKFANVHKVFGASNVAKLLNDLPAVQREDAVNSLAYEADARLRDPIYGCVGLISILQHKLKQVQMDLFNAKKELSAYIGPSAMLPILPAPGNFIPPYQQQPSQMIPYNMQPAQMMGGSPHNVANPGPLVIQQQHNYQQIMEAQQVAAVVAAAREQEILRNYEQQQAVLTQQQGHHHSDQLRYDAMGQEHIRGGVFNHMGVSAGMAPALVLGSYEGPYQTQQHTENDQPHHQLQATQTFLEEQQQQGLALTQPQQLDPQQQQQGLALAQPQQLDLQQQQLPLQQQREGSEED